MFNIKLLDEVEPLGQESCLSSDLLMPLQISIGEIEIPIYKIIKLEQSDVIAINLSENSLVTLLLGGEPVATAEMQVIGEKIELKINKVFLHREEQKNDNQDVELEEL